MPSDPHPDPGRRGRATEIDRHTAQLYQFQAQFGTFTVQLLKRGSLRGLTLMRESARWRWPPILN